MRLPAVKKRADLMKLAKMPVCVAGAFLQIRFCQSDGSTKFLISVSTRCGNAVRRNRIRRIIREWCRINYHQFSDGKMWMIKVSPSIEELSDNALSRAIRDELTEFLPCFANHSQNY